MPRPKQFTKTIQPALAGIVRKLGFQQEEPFSCIDSLNFRPIDARDGRRVTCTRPALVTLPSPGANVTMLAPIDGDGAFLPQVTFLAARAGLLYRWNGIGFTQIDSTFSPPAITSSRPVFAAPYLLKVVIANNGTPLVYDHTASGGAVIQRLKPLTSSIGSVPIDCRVVAAWQGAVWFAGAPASSHILYASRTGDLTDFNYAALPDDEGGAFATAGQNEGMISGPVVALMPQTEDTMIVGCPSQMYAMRGHPRRGGTIGHVSERVGPMGQGAWCKTPGDTIYMLTRAGMMALDSQAHVMPISRDKVPDDLVGLQYDMWNPVVTMGYDARWNGIHICVRGPQQQAWWYDLEQGGFHRDTFADYPTVMMPFPDFDTRSQSGLVWGGAGYGGLARLDADGTETFAYRQLIGPLKISQNSTYKTLCRLVQCVFALPTDLASGSVNLWFGHDAEECYQNAQLNRPGAKVTMTLSMLAANNGIIRPLMNGAAMIVELVGTVGANGPVIFEGAEAEFEDAGRNRTVRNWLAAPEVDAGLDITVDDGSVGGGSGAGVNDAWTGYASATPVNPAATQTDFSFLVDLWQLPQQWWNAVAPTGADVRAYVGGLAVPCDLIHFDKAARSGLLVLKKTKTTSNQVVQLYVGNQLATSPAAGDTYGRWNAYASHVRGFWPDGNGTDRTAYLNDLTGPVAAAVNGPLPSSLATAYGGLDLATATASIPVTDPLSLMAWCKTNADGADMGLLSVDDNATLETFLQLSGATSGQPVSIGRDNGGRADSTAGFASHAWCLASGVSTSAVSRTAYSNGANSASDVTNLAIGAYTRIALGERVGGAKRLKGSLSLVSLHTTALAASWIAYVQAQRDQIAFWGSWSWTAL